MPESSARRKDRDLLSSSRLELDALEPHEMAAYKSGLWIGRRVSSAKLGRRSSSPHTDVAELAARARVQVELMREQA